MEPNQSTPDRVSSSEKIRVFASPTSSAKFVNTLPSYRIGAPKVANQMFPLRSWRMLRMMTFGMVAEVLPAVGM
jgi:hypothetical protein